MSDGADNNAGTLTPAESLAVARLAGVAIHALQFGSDPYAAGRAGRIEPNPQPGLADLARLSGGHYDAILSAADATRVIQAVGRLEPTLASPRPPPAGARMVLGGAGAGSDRAGRCAGLDTEAHGMMDLWAESALA